MRVNTLLRKLVDVSGLVVDGARFRSGGLEIDVRPRWWRPRCATCAKRAPQYDRRPPRRWRHLPFGPWLVWLVYAPRRVQCPRCGIGTEQLPWAAPGRTRFSWALEETAAYLAAVTDKTATQRLLGISWRSVGEIVERVVARGLDPSRLDGVRFLGVDEFSYRKRHRYLTIVVDHERGRVIWARPGRSSETLEGCFDELGEERIAQIEAFTIDMAGGYIKAIQDRAPEATLVFDRFHVQRLASDAVDEVRRSVMRELQHSDEHRAIKRSRFALLKNPWNLSHWEHGKLAEVQRHNAPLYRAYLLKEALAETLSSLRPEHAMRKLDEWLAWASRSRLAPFVRVARTIRKHQDGIQAYIALRLTNGFTEGINNRIRMIARRAFGFHSPEALIAMIFLTCGGIELHPTLPEPT